MRFLSNCLCNYSQIGFFDTKTYRNKVQQLSPTFCNGTAVCPVICSCLGKFCSAHCTCWSCSLHICQHLSPFKCLFLLLWIWENSHQQHVLSKIKTYQHTSKFIRFINFYQHMSKSFHKKLSNCEVVVLAPRYAPSRAAQPSNQRHRLRTCHEMIFGKWHENWRWKTCFETIELFILVSMISLLKLHETSINSVRLPLVFGRLKRRVHWPIQRVLRSAGREVAGGVEGAGYGIWFLRGFGLGHPKFKDRDGTHQNISKLGIIWNNLIPLIPLRLKTP